MPPQDAPPPAQTTTGPNDILTTFLERLEATDLPAETKERLRQLVRRDETPNPDDFIAAITGGDQGAATPEED